MHFAWTDVNHCAEGHETLHDPKLAITGMLVDLGHTVSDGGMTVRTSPAMNLIFEGFNADGVAWARDMRRAGCRFTVVCTERFGASGSLNDSPYPDMAERQKFLPAAAELAESCWCLVPGMATRLKPYCRNSFDIELGFSAARERLLRTDEEPDTEFCFHGGTLGRRSVVIKLLRDAGAGVVTPRDLMTQEQKARIDGLVWNGEVQMSDYGPLSVRNRALAKAKVSLGLRPLDGWKLASSARFQAALHVGRPVLAEEIDDTDAPTPWRQVVPFVATEDLYLVGMKIAARWREARDAQLARFKHYLSPARAIGHALSTIN
ncbi:MAG TPA: hypothetical protein VF957_23460 [Bradyrhizobium sp.]